MRFASSLFVGVALLLVVSVGLTTLRHAPPNRPTPASSSSPNAAVMRRLKAKDAVTRRLIGGELTLWEAAAWFRYITRTMASAGDVPPWAMKTNRRRNGSAARRSAGPRRGSARSLSNDPRPSVARGGAGRTTADAASPDLPSLHANGCDGFPPWRAVC